MMLDAIRCSFQGNMPNLWHRNEGRKVTTKFIPFPSTLWSKLVDMYRFCSTSTLIIRPTKAFRVIYRKNGLNFRTFWEIAPFSIRFSNDAHFSQRMFPAFSFNVKNPLSATSKLLTYPKGALKGGVFSRLWNRSKKKTRAPVLALLFLPFTLLKIRDKILSER